MQQEGFATAFGVQNVCYNKFGFHFQTPEAYYQNGSYRYCTVHTSSAF